MRLNKSGRMVQTAWDELPSHYLGVKTDAFVIMPNHIHAIIVLSVGAGPNGTAVGKGIVDLKLHFSELRS